MSREKDKLQKIYSDVFDLDSIYKGDLEDINYVSQFCKAGEEGRLYSMSGNNICSFLHTYEDSSAALIIFAIPTNIDEEVGVKHVAERVMDVIELCEQCFTTLDYSESKEVKEDRFVYVTIIKKFNEYYLRR